MNRTLAFALLFAACHAAPSRPMLRDVDYPGTLRAPTALAKDVVWQQRVTANWGEGRQRGFDAAVQKRGDTLTVLGLSPMGSVGFAVVQRAAGIELQNDSHEELPFPPRCILLDVQRALYPWLPAAPPGDGERDGEREGTVDGEVVHERWAAGRLQQRSFRREDGKPEGSIVVRYEWQHPEWFGPSRVVLDNGWFGYRLVVETHAETLLAGDGGALVEPPRHD